LSPEFSASRYEVGAHLIEPNTELDCRRNWLGDKNEEKVWNRIFDRKDRYNLAKIAYIPYLLANNINTELALERPGNSKFLLLLSHLNHFLYTCHAYRLLSNG
jgi:hypothetical protein